MSYLGLGLFAEGASDHVFLGPILRRLVVRLVVREGSRPLDVSDEVLAISAAAPGRGGRAQQIVLAATEARGAIHLLFVHADAGGSADRALEERVRPGIELVAREHALLRLGCVPVVPVRETEAWALVDGDALRAAFGTTRSDGDLGVPDGAEQVERLRAPKATLEGPAQEDCRLVGDEEG